MGNWLRRSMADDEPQQKASSQQRGVQEDVALTASRQVSEDSYQQLMNKLAAERAEQRNKSERQRQVERTQVEAGLKATAWQTYTGTAASFDQGWPVLYAQLLASAAKRQQAIDRASGPYGGILR